MPGLFGRGGWKDGVEEREPEERLPLFGGGSFEDSERTARTADPFGLPSGQEKEDEEQPEVVKVLPDGRRIMRMTEKQRRESAPFWARRAEENAIQRDYENYREALAENPDAFARKLNIARTVDLPSHYLDDPEIFTAAAQAAGFAIQGVMDPVFEYGVAPFMGGAISGTTRFADAAGYLADKIGADTIRDKMFQIGKAGGQLGADLTRETAPEDLGAIGQFIRATAGAAGSSLPSLALGMAAAPAQGASWASNTAMALHGGSDALGEAGDTMREVLANGGSIEEARSAANKVAVANLLYNAIAEPLAGPFSGWGEAIPGLRGHLMRGAVRGGEEMIQETLQDMWSAAAQKRREDEQPVTYGDVFGNFLAEGKNLPAYLQESGAPAFLSSFLMGAGMPHVAAKDTQQLQQTTKEPSFTPEQRGDLLRWAHGETGRMAEEAQFAEDGTPENPLSEADLARYQEIRDAMKRRDYVALAEMRRVEESAQSRPQPEYSYEDAAVELTPEAVKAVAPRKGRYTDMDEFVAAATSPEGKKIGGSIWIDLDPISNETADKIQDNTGIDVHGYGHALDGSSIVHILNRHGEGGTRLKDFPNQVPLTARDFNLLPGVIEDADVIEPGGKNRIVFKKRINGHFIVVEETRNRFGKLVPVTARKEKAAASPSTSETLLTPSEPVGAMPPFEATLSSPGETVNRQQKKSLSLRSAPPAPEPAPAPSAADIAISGPEDDANVHYGNSDFYPNVPPKPTPVKDGEQYEQQGVGPTGTVPDQAESIRAKGSVRSRTPAEIRRLGKDVEARMVAAGRSAEEAKAMGLLASEFAGRFAKRTGIQPAEALDFEMRQGKAQGVQGGGYDQASARQSEDYDPGDPKTWPAGPARDEALALEAWQKLEDDDEIETWPESPEKTEALALQKEYREIDAWIENLPREEFDRRLRNDDPEFVRKNERGVELEKELHALRRDLRKKKPKGAAKRLLQLIEAEEEAAAREAETYYQSAYQGSPHRGIKKMSLKHIGTGEGSLAYGYGMYSAENRDVAEEYRKALIGRGLNAVGMLDGQKIDLGPFSQLRDSTEAKTDPVSFAFCSAYGDNFNVPYTIERLEWYVENSCETDLFARPEVVREALALLKSGRLKIDAKSMQGQLYRLEVPENDVLLDWDKPLSQQPEKVKAAIREIAAELTPEDVKQLGGNTDMLLFNEITGQQLYAMLAWLPSVDSEKAASMLLLKHGIPGLRYLDQGSRRAGKGTHNFVIWDEDAMSVEETYYQSASRESPRRNIDKEYFAALEAGDMETAQKIVDEQARQKGYARDSEYRMDHRAPNSKYDDNLATIRESGLVPDDYWTKPQWYQSSGEEYEAFYAVKKALDSPRKTIRMYRAIPKGVKESEFRNGDWITPSRAYAQMEGQEIPGGYRIITDVVKTKDVWWDGNSICEFGYDDGKGYAYKDTRNNRKLTEVIVRDSDGAIIPPSKRFNSRRFETYYQRQAEETENIRRGQAAMEKVIAEQTDVMDAMHRDDLGSISFLWGEPGRGPKFKGGAGVSHIIAHRNAQGYDGEAVARKMVEVIAKGEAINRRGPAGGERVDITHDGYTAVLSLYKDGERQTWLLSGWEDYKKETPDVSSEGDGSTGTTLHGPMRARPEEGAGASDKSKPPVAQKDKGESTAPNGRTYFLPDGTSVIEFFEMANKSTSFHEFGHHILNKMVEFSGMEGVDPQLAEDVKTILEEAGVSREAFDADTDGAKTKAHEFFAREFETYLSEGKAPTARLRDAFRRIRNWMIEVYNDTAKVLGIELSDEMRGVYNRLFASDGAFGDIYGAGDVKAGTNDPAKTQGEVQPRPKTETTKTRGGVEVERQVRDTSNDTRMMDLFNSPNVVAQRHGKFRPFFGMAKEAVEKQERMRSNWNKAVDAIYGKRGILKKDQVSLFNEVLLAGDALGKAFTADELRGRGFDDGMVRAYRLVRGLYDNAHRMLSAQRNKYGKEDVAYREGYVPHFFHAWRVLEDGKIVTSYRSMNEAIKAAEKMKKEGENRNIRVAPALDDFGGRGKLDAVTLGDMQYFKLVGNIGKAFELSADEARALLEDAARMKGRSRVFKNAWERKGVAGFEQNMEYALRHYLNLSARYIAMDTLKHDGINLFERTFGRFDNDHKGLARYTKDYINDVLGVPSNVEQTLNNWVRNSWLGKYLPNVIGDRPATVAANSIASLTAHCKLGFLNIASAAMNLSQLNGTQAIIGPAWTVKALAEYLHPNQMTLRLYADAGVEENITAENPSGYSKVHQARGLRRGARRRRSRGRCPASTRS